MVPLLLVLVLVVVVLLLLLLLLLLLVPQRADSTAGSSGRHCTPWRP